MHLRERVSRYAANSQDDQVGLKAVIMNRLLKNLDRRRQLRRCMSIHVGSRWYRAPEVCLVERQYDQASDMWGFGCILHELLRYIVDQGDDAAFKDYPKDRFLFQGQSCFPISPVRNFEVNPAEAEGMQHKKVVGKQDQVLMILKGLGTQTDNDLSFITSDFTKKYVYELQDKSIPISGNEVNA